MSSDLLTVIEAAYELDAEDHAWGEGLTATIGPFIDRGMGAYGATVDANDPARVKLGALHSYRGQESMLRAIADGHAAADAQLIERMYRSGCPLISTTSTVGVARWERIAEGGPGGVGDCSAVCALDTDGRGYSVMAPSKETQRHTLRARRMWSRVTAHVVAMQRLRSGLPAMNTRARAEGEAVLSPGGKVEHAEGAAKDGSARAMLREAALARERARGRLRKREPEEAVEMWQALVAGRWSIVDRFDRDGRRYLIAHQNEPESAGPRALTPREQQVVARVAMGHSNKLIAYELGLSTGAIGRYLTTAIRKLGMTSRLEVARLLRAAWMTQEKPARHGSRTPK